ncbi:N-acetylmuramoyl-L-alanine amidase family protein [Butyrivibrio sp. FCS014]|uniref:N-acetylmuramoyl-L-alanine amidase family protein n=1 Tax=Butyrivibrio sp. FCS014 TaxID=1408304 RepID=UPI000467A8B0|nr:N-acetylmuramoyl-L-alanine amidase [Butyrivibrio sp. FCS014]
MKTGRRILSVLMVSVSMLVMILTAFTAVPVKAKAATPITIVIDPGHGGVGDRNLGAQYNGFSEKELTLQLATALKAELEKYDNVTVLLTRTTDTILSLDSRAQYAKNVGADFVFSIHFNASNEHEFYGSEVWTSTFGNYYQKGTDFGRIVSGEWNKLGLYQKGVKTKIGSKGQDYYGIIRGCVERGVPCVIMEHAYLDHDYDVSLLRTSGFINKLAVSDATAIAKYFNLKSTATGADYTGFTYTHAKKPYGRLYQDETGPETCSIKVLAQDAASGNILVEMTTHDSQSPVIYFSYSYDGGRTFCTLQMWDRTKDTQSFNIKVPSGTNNPVVVCRSYNNYEKMSESTPVQVTGSFNY